MDFQISPEWQTFHLYNRLVRRGLTKPLAHSCDTEFVLRLGEEDKPVLVCYLCNTTTHPGLKMYSDIRAVVKEHFDE